MPAEKGDPVIVVSWPVAEVMENAETLFVPALATYKNVPVVSTTTARGVCAVPAMGAQDRA